MTGLLIFVNKKYTDSFKVLFRRHRERERENERGEGAEGARKADSTLSRDLNSELDPRTSRS